MSENGSGKETGRARVFALMHQKSRAETSAARIRRLAAREVSAEDLEQFKSAAMRSLRAGSGELPSGHV